MDKDKRFAVLIDADNISPKYIDIILTETANYGTASIRRIYGTGRTIPSIAGRNVCFRIP